MSMSQWSRRSVDGETTLRDGADDAARWSGIVAMVFALPPMVLSYQMFWERWMGKQYNQRRWMFFQMFWLCVKEWITWGNWIQIINSDIASEKLKSRAQAGKFSSFFNLPLLLCVSARLVGSTLGYEVISIFCRQRFGVLYIVDI